MSYTNLNNPANYQLQSFGQDGMRTVSTTQAYVEGEYYRVILAVEDSTISATSMVGDNLTNISVYAGTAIYGLFTAITVSVGKVNAYLAGRTDIDDVWAYIRAYGEANGATIENEQCAKDAIEPLLDKYYAQASLVMVPSLYKTSIVYSERPLSAAGQLTFTRNSLATYIGSDGVMVIPEHKNAVRYSDPTFAEGPSNYVGYTPYSWGILGLNRAIVYSGFNATQYHYAGSLMHTAGPYTISAYVVMDDGSVPRVGPKHIDYDMSFALFGRLVSEDPNDVTIELVEGDIYRIQMTVQPEDFGAYETNNGVICYADQSRKPFKVSGLQIENRPTASDYVPTNGTALYFQTGAAANCARMDYSSGGSCPAMLLEPQRTNLIFWSEELTQYSWTRGSGAGGTLPVVTKDYTISPNGHKTADRVQFNAGASGYSFIYNTPSISFTTTGAFTIYAKSLTADVQNIAIKFGASSQVFPVGPEWERLTFLNFGAGTGNIQIGTGAAIGGGDQTLDVALWGAQAEDETYPTSYIPTSWTTVTRLAEEFYKTGISSFIGQTEGVLFWEFENTSNGKVYIQTSDGTNNNWIVTGIDSGKILIQISTGGVVQVSNYTTNLSLGRHKAAIGYANNNVVLYLDGNLIYSDTSATIPSTSVFKIGRNPTSTQVDSSGTYQVLLFKTRLSNADLETLTTL